MKTYITKKIQEYQQLFNETYQKTLTQGASGAWKEQVHGGEQ